MVNGRVEGPIHGGEVLLKSHAYVVGDIEHETLAIESGAYFDGRSVHVGHMNGHAKAEKVSSRSRKAAAENAEDTIAAA